MPKNVKSIKYNGISVRLDISRKELDNVAEHHSLTKAQADAFWKEIQKVKEGKPGEIVGEEK